MTTERFAAIERAGLCMRERPEIWLVAHGEELVAELVVEQSDPPWFRGRAVPRAGFAALEPLFDRERRLVRRDLGEILAHGEPERGIGQGEAAEQPTEQSPGQAFWDEELRADQAELPVGDRDETAEQPSGESQDNGVVVVDFGGVGPEAA